MTVLSDYAPAVYAGNDTTYLFPFPWPIHDLSHLVVVHTDDEGVATTLVRNVNYTVAWVGPGQPGTVRRIRFSGETQLDYPLPFDETLTLSRDVPLTQETNLRSQGKLPAEVIERALDRQLMISQQIAASTHAVLHASVDGGNIDDTYVGAAFSLDGEEI